MKYEALAGFLMVATITGILLALILTTAAVHGTMPRNSSRLVPMAARAAMPTRLPSSVIRLGDPFKDTAGPSLHVPHQASRYADARAGTLFI